VQADSRFQHQPKSFWANVRTISQELGYTARRSQAVRVYSLEEMAAAMTSLGLGISHLVRKDEPTVLGERLLRYFTYRAEILNTYVEPRLMNAEAAREMFNEYRNRFQPKCPLPMNKQKGEKAGPNPLSGLVNILVEAYSDQCPVNYNPLELTTFTKSGAPLRTLARRVDGCFPSPVNPIAIWEIKEYYYTTTFGSRVADGVYETLLDGMELEELQEKESVPCEHLLIADSHYTWWECGRSYLCRLVDILNMGYVDELLFGREVVERLPEIVPQWVRALRSRSEALPE
jgi:hypothetical protein